MSAMVALLAVGDELPRPEVGPITRTTLALFAGGSGDHNPIHIDTDFALRAGMPDVIAHGMLTAAYFGRLLTGSVLQDRIRKLSVRFVAPTPVGARPACSATVTALEEQEDGSRLATLTLVATLEDGTVTLTGSAQILLSADEAGESQS
ncbi:MaoC/PaaZ C-terminal domain-containing protein [uncultured Jatrophihabitans sp.]|uniref:MaoC/PaaZ C-terminal domain-containing protein n=1 Tax=uncultured Jatrophihabitans sp. TaxID=1610747 RepID=UPI0035CAD28C